MPGYRFIQAALLGALGQKAMGIGFPYNSNWYRAGGIMWLKAEDLCS